MSDTDKWYISGPLGIGTADPIDGELTIFREGYGSLSFFGSAGDVQFDGGGDKIFAFNNVSGGHTVFLGGNVGIGTTNPKRRLQIGDEVPGIGFEPSDGSPNSGYIRFGDQTGWKLHFGRSTESSGGVLNTGTAGVLMTLQDNGNVGIGTQAPAAKLQFDNSGGNKVVVYDNGPTDRYGFGLNNGNLNAFVPAGGHFSIRQNGYDGTEVMTVTGVGNVGIGTTGPTHPLHLKTGWSFVALDTNAAGQDSGIRLMEAGAVKWHIWNSADKANLRIQRDGASFPAIAIDQNSNVGIGTSTPGGALHVDNNMLVGPVSVNNGRGSITVSGPGAALCLVKRGIDSMPATPVAGDVFTWHNTNGAARLWTYEKGDVLSIDTNGFIVTGNNGGVPNLAGGVTTWDVIAQGTIWCANDVVAKHGTVKMRDLAENYHSDLELEAGDVVCLDRKEHKIVKSERANDKLLLGVISTNPGLLLGGEHGEENGRPDGKRAYPVALSGRVPCKVTDENGPISRGDALTSSSTPGHAMKATPIVVGGVEIYAPGTIIGKALESFNAEVGIIELFVTLK